MAEVFPSPPLLGKRRVAPMDADDMEEASGGGGGAGPSAMTPSVSDAAVGMGMGMGMGVGGGGEGAAMAMEGEDGFFHGGCKRRRAVGYEPSAALGMFGAGAPMPAMMGAAGGGAS
jgi:hypothetical protein